MMVNLKVTGLHPKVAEAAHKTIEEARARGLAVGLQSGLRTAEEQDALYAKGRIVPGEIVTNAKAWDGLHNYGLAVDLVFKDAHGNWTWEKPFLDWKALGDVGVLYGFTWGGNWIKLKDYPHFQMMGQFKTIQEMRELLFESGIEKVWEKI